MTRQSPQGRAIKAIARKIEFIFTIQQAIDRSYRRLREAACADWERLVTGADPSDKCANVKIHAAKKTTRALPGSGFLKSRRPVEAKSSAKRSARFAH